MYAVKIKGWPNAVSVWESYIPEKRKKKKNIVAGARAVYRRAGQ